MPKHVERDHVVVVPGAFGLDQSKGRWERRNRPNAQYLTRTGVYANQLYIYISEEYGYASYLWVYPGTPKELVEDWCAQRVPWSCGPLVAVPDSLEHYRFRGEFEPVNFRSIEADRETPFPRRIELILQWTGEVIEGFSHIDHFDGNAHIHEEEDSDLRVGFYEVTGIREPKVNILILDALAAIR